MSNTKDSSERRPGRPKNFRGAIPQDKREEAAARVNVLVKLAPVAYVLRTHVEYLGSPGARQEFREVLVTNAREAAGRFAAGAGEAMRRAYEDKAEELVVKSLEDFERVVLHKPSQNLLHNFLHELLAVGSFKDLEALAREWSDSPVTHHSKAAIEQFRQREIVAMVGAARELLKAEPPPKPFAPPDEIVSRASTRGAAKVRTSGRPNSTVTAELRRALARHWARHDAGGPLDARDDLEMQPDAEAWLAKGISRVDAALADPAVAQAFHGHLVRGTGAGPAAAAFELVAKVLRESGATKDSIRGVCQRAKRGAARSESREHKKS